MSSKKYPGPYLDQVDADLDALKSPEDKNRADRYLDSRITSRLDDENNALISLNETVLNLGPIKKEHLPLVEKIVRALIIEKSVCEARLHLLAQCKAEIAKKGVMPLYEAPDVLFNPSTFRPYTGIVRHEAMQLVFPNTEYARTQLVNFTNSLPENVIPPNVIEGTEDATPSSQ